MKQQLGQKERDLEDEDDARYSWNQWVPMDRDLYSAVQHVQLCMLQCLDEVFSEAGIRYWITGGTLLGAIRHGGFIPHDDDVDIECYCSDLDRITAHIPSNPPLYMGFEREAGRWEGHPVGKLTFFRGEFKVDVFPRSDDLVEEHPSFPSHTEVYPLRRYNFCNIQVWGPGGKDIEAYLDRTYGKNWRDTVCVWNHDFNWFHGASFDPQKVVLSLQEYNGVVDRCKVHQPVADESAMATFQAFCNQHPIDEFEESYRKYRRQRVIRQNQAAAEWRERQSEQR